MENNGQPPVKQQLTETLREAESVVIATSKDPGRDEVAAAIGLHLLLSKLDMVAEVVITGKIPDELKFLPSDFIHAELQGQRDFVIELDQSSTEADHLKYVTEDNKLKIYVTPYNGVFSDKDVNFSYGDYHCDAIIGLGVNDVGQMDDAVTKEQKLIQNAKFLFITNGPGSGNNLVWSDPTASSICEMVMSMSEALGSGMLDKQIATALFAGIVDKTRHFTNASTTPKVMTMAAQLLAAGADQAEVVKQLAPETKTPQPPKETPDKKEDTSAKEPGPQQPPKQPQPQEHQQPSNEFQIRKNKNASQPQESSQQKPAPESGGKPDVKPEPEKSQPPTPTPTTQPDPGQGDPHGQDQQPPQKKPDSPGPPQQNSHPQAQPSSGDKPTDKSPTTPPPPETISGTLNMQHDAPPKQPPKPNSPSPPQNQPPQSQPQSPSQGVQKDVEIDHTGSPKEKVVNPPSASQPQAPKPPETNASTSAGPQTGTSQPPAGNASQPSQNPGDGNAPKPPESDALEAARKAVEEAHGGNNQGQNQNQSPNSNPPQQPPKPPQQNQ